MPKSLKASRPCHAALFGIHFIGLSTNLCLLGKWLFQHYQMWKESPFLLKCCFLVLISQWRACLSKLLFFCPQQNKMKSVSYKRKKYSIFLQSSSSELCCSHKLSSIISFWAKTKQGKFRPRRWKLSHSPVWSLWVNRNESSDFYSWCNRNLALKWGARISSECEAWMCSRVLSPSREASERKTGVVWTQGNYASLQLLLYVME